METNSLRCSTARLGGLGIGHTGEGIVAVGEVGADGVGLSRLHGRKGLVQHADLRGPSAAW